MSFKSWLNQFYPVPATDESECLDVQDAMDHSFLKWRGTFPHNLKEHAVNVYGSRVASSPYSLDPSFLDFTASNCALCEYQKDVDGFSCSECPLIESGMTASGVECDREYGVFLSPSRFFTKPKFRSYPMLMLLANAGLFLQESWYQEDYYYHPLNERNIYV